MKIVICVYWNATCKPPWNVESHVHICDVYMYSNTTANLPYAGQLLTYGVLLQRKSSNY